MVGRWEGRAWQPGEEKRRLVGAKLARLVGEALVGEKCHGFDVEEEESQEKRGAVGEEEEKVVGQKVVEQKVGVVGQVQVKVAGLKLAKAGAPGLVRVVDLVWEVEEVLSVV